MPIYYFDIDDGQDHTGDKLGTELPDVAAATIEAAALAGDLLRDRPRDFWNTQEWRLTVENEEGLVLFSIVVAAIVAPSAAAVIPRPRRVQRM